MDLDDSEGPSPSERVQPLLGLLERVARSEEHVIVSGARRSDREWIARFIHTASPRQGRQFVIYAAATPNRSGALAATRRDDSVAHAWFGATGGTLFIAELYDLPDRDQAQLLRFLESRDSHRGVAPRRATVRIVAATRSDVEMMSPPASFRSSLFHRLNVLHVHVPADPAIAVASEDALRSHSTFREEKTRLLEAWEPTYLRALLSHVDGNLALAARTAGIARAHLYRLLKKYGLAR